MAKKETAEQKLLKMIEASGSPDASKTQKKVAKKQSMLSVLKTVNKILLVVILVAVFLVFNEVRVGMALMGKDIQINPAGAAGRAANLADMMPTLQRLSYYLASVKRRNIFKPYEAKKTASVVETSSDSTEIVRATENLKLVGISWLDTIESASAMIENVEEKTTYFLQKGESMGDIIVKTIYAESVELGYENEEIIIRYDKSQM